MIFFELNIKTYQLIIIELQLWKLKKRISGMKFQMINPSTEKSEGSFVSYEKNQVNAYIDSAHLSFLSWKTTSFKQRQMRMLKLAQLLREQSIELSKMMAREMGKPITAGKGEIEKSAWVCEHYAERAEEYLSTRLIDTEMLKTAIVYQPLGIIFAIMPWNFPFWQVFRFAAPNLMAGNAAILKHAPICFGSGNKIAELFLEAGFPEHLFQHFVIDDQMASEVIANPKVKGVTLTGSERAGQCVAREAGQNLKKVVLELGGSDPYIVLEDADLELAADKIVQSRMNNSGQVCISAKRVIAIKSLADELAENIEQKLKKIRIGDPLDESTSFGPLARADLRQTVHQQVVESKEKGAVIRCGGEIPNMRGFYYPPTLLTNVKPGMPAFDDEIFGPVIAMISADDEAHAIKLANQTSFGLGAAVFTKNLENGEKIATQDIDAGSCFVNDFVSSDPRVPFGGINNSGYGRELSEEGIKEFVNIKTISIK